MPYAIWTVYGIDDVGGGFYIVTAWIAFDDLIGRRMNNMIKIYIDNLPEKLEKGVAVFLENYGVGYGQGSVTLSVQYSVSDKTGVEGNTIYYKKYVDIFRYLVKWLDAYRAKMELSYFEKRQFDTFGIMLDLSRNAVMHVAGIKKYIQYLAGFGVDRIM